jgi:proteasome accessory factor C
VARHARQEFPDAVHKLNSMVSLVAELSKRRAQELPPVALGELASVLDVSVADVQRHIRELTRMSDNVDANWLLSLQIILEGGTVEGGSGGPFQRPMRLTPEEALVLRLSLGLAEDGSVDAAAIEPLLQPVSKPLAVEPYRREAGVTVLLDVLSQAIDGQKKVQIRYAGAGGGDPVARRIQPWQVLVHRGRTYAVAWCELRDGWRRFRLDRILDAELLDEAYEPREDCPYDDVFDQAADPDEVRVRFAPTVARWIREWAPDADVHDDGGVTVTYQAASADWLVERVLQYGAEAEVVEPEFYREAVRRAVS